MGSFSCTLVPIRPCAGGLSTDEIWTPAITEYEGNVLSASYILDRNCNRTGAMTTYHENGYMASVGVLADGVRIGPYYKFNPDGTIISLEYFDFEGRMDGICRYYLPNGRMFKLCQYDKGQLLRCDDVRYAPE
jgi:antitoxin component YwqK of YwqJK toxin-antitoxin module